MSNKATAPLAEQTASGKRQVVCINEPIGEGETYWSVITDHLNEFIIEQYDKYVGQFGRTAAIYRVVVESGKGQQYVRRVIRRWEDSCR